MDEGRGLKTGGGFVLTVISAQSVSVLSMFDPSMVRGC